MSTDEPTVRQRMETLGWIHGVDEDTCATTWIKVGPDRVVTHYHPGSDTAIFQADLDACQREYGYHDGKSAYA